MAPGGWLDDRRPVRRIAGASAPPPGTTSSSWRNWRRYLDQPMRYLRHVIDAG